MLAILRRRQTRLFAISFLFCTSLLGTGSGTIGRSTPVSIFPGTSAAQAQTFSDEAIATGIQSYVLDNGLTVLLQPDRSKPLVGINLVYGVGTADESADEVGVAHLIEHLMFGGTKDRPIGFGRLFYALGSSFNGTTFEDRTVYHHSVSAGKDKVDAILTLEADRMLNTQITAEDLAREKKVVEAERTVFKNDSGVLLHEVLLQAGYPDRAYGQPILGTQASVEGLTRAQVNTFYKKYYTPSNATLVVVGDFDAGDTLDTIKSVFGPLANTQEATPRPTGLVAPAEAIPMTEQTEPLVLQRPGVPSLVQVNLPLPNVTHPDFPAITVLHVLLKDREGYRLDTALVEEQQIAESVNLIQEYRREPGWYNIQVYGKPEQSSEAVYEALRQTLAQRIKQLEQPVEPTMLAQVKEAFEASVLDEVESLEGRADVLAEVQMLVGDPYGLDRLVTAIGEVTSEDLLRVAQKYLNLEDAVVGFLEPTPDTSELQLVEDEPIDRFERAEPIRASAFDRLASPISLEVVKKYLPPIAGDTTIGRAAPEKLVLDNGLQVLLLPDSEAQEVTIRGWVDAGDRFDLEGKAGTALLTARGLVNNPEREQDISFAASTDLDGATLSAKTEESNLAAGLETLASYFQASNLLDSAVEETQQQLSDRVERRLASTTAVNRLAFQQAIYPEGHPAHQVATAKSVDAISHADLEAFHARHYRPDNTIIALVGKFDAAQVKSQLAQTFGTWQAKGPVPTLPLSSVSMPQSSLYLEREVSKRLDDIPGAYAIMGHSTISRNDPRYYALQVAVEILGGRTLASRLSDNLREQQGLSYSGAIGRIDAGRDRGEFELLLSIPDSQDLEQAVASTIAVLKQAQAEGLTAGELQMAKQSLTERYAKAMLNPDEAARVAIEGAANHLDDELQNYPNKIRAVTLQEAQSALESLIEPDKMVVVTTSSK